MKQRRTPTVRQSEERPSEVSIDSVSASQPARLAAISIVTVKLALMAIIAWVAVSTLAAFFEWGRGPQQIAAEDNSELENVIQPPPVPPLLLSAFDDGTWEFAGMPWQVRMATVQATDVERELELLPPTKELTTALNSQEGEKLMSVLRMMGAKEREVGEFKLLQSDTSTGKITLVSRAGPTGDELVLGRIAWPDGNAWRLVEGRPTAAVATQKNASMVAPPTPDDAEVLGTRWANDGTLLGKIVTLTSPRGTLVTSWKEAGWSVGRAPIESTGADNTPLLLIEREGVCFSAHFLESPGAPTTLFLTRVPD